MDNMELILMREAVDLDYSKEWVDLMNNGRCYRDYCLFAVEGVSLLVVPTGKRKCLIMKRNGIELR